MGGNKALNEKASDVEELENLCFNPSPPRLSDVAENPLVTASRREPSKRHKTAFMTFATNSAFRTQIRQHECQMQLRKLLFHSTSSLPVQRAIAAVKSTGLDNTLRYKINDCNELDFSWRGVTQLDSKHD
jgi:hypothetical protein